MAVKVRTFATALGARAGLPVQTWDERLTTCLVERSMVAADVSRLTNAQTELQKTRIAIQASDQARIAFAKSYPPPPTARRWTPRKRACRGAAPWCRRAGYGWPSLAF